MNKKLGQIIFWPYKRSPKVGETIKVRFLPEIGVEIKVLKILYDNVIRGEIKYIDLRGEEI